MSYRKHYFNRKTKKMACENYGRNRYPAYRDFTEDKTKVTCKHCLTVLTRWEKKNEKS